MELSAAEVKLLGLLEEGAKRPVGRHTRYRFVGATQEGDALVVFRASPKRAMEALTLAAMVESMPLEAAVRCCALIACSNNNLLLHATGHNRSDRERAIMIAGYGTTYFPWR